jgi:hypothetical protein
MMRASPGDNEKEETTDYAEGMASPTYYCSRNTQMPEEKSWNANKVLQHSNTDYTDFFVFSSCPFV